MKLTDYLRDRNLSAAEFARRIGVESRMAVVRYCSGVRIPRPEVMARIVAETRGAVQPNDFYGLPSRLPSLSEGADDPPADPDPEKEAA